MSAAVHPAGPIVIACTVALAGAGCGLQPRSGARSDAEEEISPRESIELRRGWRFLRADAASAERSDLDDSSWQEVDLPHTWNAVDGQDGGNDYHRGTAWYRKRFRLPADAAGRRVFLEVDAAGNVARVHLNGHPVGEHRGGYARFRFDVTDRAVAGRDNLLAVAVDNAEATDIAPLGGADFTYFGGLYRGVRLILTDRLHVDALDHGGPGVTVRQSRVTRASADVDIEALVRNDGRAAVPATVDVVVRDAGGKMVQRSRRAADIAPGARLAVAQRIRIEQPRLWNGLASGVVDPHLYRVEVRVRDGAGRPTDLVAQPLGLRFFDVDPARGFSLNGGPYRQLRSAADHG